MHSASVNKAKEKYMLTSNLLCNKLYLTFGHGLNLQIFKAL